MSPAVIGAARSVAFRARPVSTVVSAAMAWGALAGCAVPLKDPWGQAVSRGEPPPARHEPRALQAELGLRPEAPGSFPLSARLYAEPGRRYRLDVFGLFTPVAASWFWRDGGWTLVRHDTRTVATGRGSSFVQAGETPLVLPDVHAVLGFLWGAPLPGFPGDAGTVAAVSDSGVVRWVHEGVPWRARFDRRTGFCLEASSPGLTVRYARHALRGGRVVPGLVEVYLADRKALALEVKERRDEPSWKKDPFVLVVPAGYDSGGVGP